MGQENIIKKFRALHPSEKWWVVTHPFIARKALAITENVLNVTSQEISDTEFDHDANGGQIDAFRHAFWMSSLAQKIRPKAAHKLGVAHEAGNKRDYDKKVMEDSSLPDEISSTMDLRNNEVGINLGKNNKHASQEEIILQVKLLILDGKLWVIKKTKDGHFLDWNSNVLTPDQYVGKWITPKTLVPSNWIRP